VIASLRGRPAARTPEGLVLDVNGVGYLVHATPRALKSALGGEEITLETYLHVREDALQLFGFAEPAERELFVQLLGVNGIGPKVALAVVSGSSPGELRKAIAREDSARFQAIPGIGKKTAERIVLELKSNVANADAFATEDLTARDALVELGFTHVEAESALAEIDSDLPVEEQVKLVLRKAA
jgi:holliday junction DNA helicase RuvA